MVKLPSVWKMRLVAAGLAAGVGGAVVLQMDRWPLVSFLRDASATVARAVGRGVSAIGHPFRLASQVMALAEQTEHQRQEMVKLRHENLALHEVLRAYQRLERLRTFHPPVGYRALPASVAAYEPTNYIKGCVIDRGARDGAFPAAVAVTDEGVVGRLVAVGERTSRLMFLTDPNCRVSVVSERTRVFGVVVGTGGAWCDLMYVPVDEDIREGDRLLTSGQGGVFPKGLPVGRVTRVVRPVGGLALDIKVEPFVKLTRLEEVLLVFPLSPMRPSAGYEDE